MALAVIPADALSQPDTPRWTITRDAFADLWYHALAGVGAERYGPLPLYSAEHTRTSSETKRRLGLHTRLDASARELRAAFARDSAFEVLHFVPPYFIGDEPGEVLTALRAAIAGTSPPAGISRSLAARAGAVVQSLPSPSERATLLTFVNALEDEWRSFVQPGRGAWSPSRDALAQLQHGWDERFSVPLAGYLRTIGRERGAIVVVPAVGAEGRIVTDPRGGTIVVVGADTYPGVSDAPLLAAVRELSFPLLDQVPTLHGEHAREVAAVRGGALLLESLAPALTEPYRTLFTVAGDGRRRHTFDSIYPLDAATDSALRDAAHRVATPGGSRQ